MKNGRVTPVVVIMGILVLLVAMLAAYSYVLAHNGDTDKLTGFLMAAILPTVSSLLLFLKTDSVDQKVDQVQQQTNGNMSRLIEAAVATSSVAEPLPGTVPAKQKDSNDAD